MMRTDPKAFGDRATSTLPIYSYRADGSLMDLGLPNPSEIDFRQVAEGLSKINRFNGRPKGLGYSVAQHSVMGADALHRETGDAFMAACFLLHDGHEYLIGDWPTPAFRLFTATLEALLPKVARGKGLPGRANDLMKTAWDGAIYEAAGLPGPDAWPDDVRAAVRSMDRRMCDAEALALFGPGTEGVHLVDPPKLKGAIAPWGAMKAEERFLDAFRRYVGEERLLRATLNHAAYRWTL